jgi:hypothetical protein
MPHIESEEDFRNSNCKNGKLTYKKNAVRNDMVEHIFPEISFKDSVCNPCDKQCKFTIIEQERLSNEDNVDVSTLA